MRIKQKELRMRSLLIVFIGLLVCSLHGFEPELPGFGTLDGESLSWRLSSYHESSASWTYEDGGSTDKQATYYYSSDSATRPDSCYFVDGSHIFTDYYTEIYEYQDYPAYREKITRSKNSNGAYNPYGSVERTDLNGRIVHYHTWRYEGTDSLEIKRDEYTYDDSGNLLQKVEYSVWGSAPFGPRKVFRKTYNEANLLLSEEEYNVLNHDLNTLQLYYNSVFCYDAQNRMVAKLYKQSVNYRYKILYAYDYQDMPALLKHYISTDSLTWTLYRREETNYELSFGEYKPALSNIWSYPANDSLTANWQEYTIYGYQDQNRDRRSWRHYPSGFCFQNTRYTYDLGNNLTYYRIDNQSEDGESYSSRQGTYNWETVVSNSNETAAPINNSLMVYPNPLRDRGKIAYSIKEPGIHRIEIFNLRGQKLMTLMEESKAAGDYSLELDFADLSLPCGIYLIRMNGTKGSISRKVMMLK